MTLTLRPFADNTFHCYGPGQGCGARWLRLSRGPAAFIKHAELHSSIPHSFYLRFADPWPGDNP
jgi:hypothetical protein